MVACVVSIYQLFKTYPDFEHLDFHLNRYFWQGRKGMNFYVGLLALDVFFKDDFIHT